MLRPLRLAPLALAAAPALAQEAPDWGEAGALFAERCVMCHSGEDAPLGLRLDSFAGAMEGSEDGPVLVAGDLAGSEILRRVRGESEPAMPLVGDPLAPEEIAMLEAWVEAGLPEGGTAEADPAPEAAPAEAGDAPAQAEAKPEEDAPEEDAPVTAALDDAEAPAAPALPGPGEAVTFAHVEPIFLRRCAKCHSDAREGGPEEGLRLDSYENVLAGGERLVLIPGNVAASEIVRRIEGVAEPRMPFDGPPWLSEEQIRAIRDWIGQGAPDAEGNPAPMPVGAEVRYRGLLTGPEEIDGIPFRITGGTRIDDRPSVGQEAEVRGVVEADGGIAATRFRDR